MLMDKVFEYITLKTEVNKMDYEYEAISLEMGQKRLKVLETEIEAEIREIAKGD